MRQAVANTTSIIDLSAANRDRAPSIPEVANFPRVVLERFAERETRDSAPHWRNRVGRSSCLAKV